MESYVRALRMSSFLHTWKKFYVFWLFVEKIPVI